MSTPNADLLRLAAEHAFPLTDRGARKMRARLGDDGARELVAAGAALVTLASAIGKPLSPLAALRRLDAVSGDYERAAARLLGDYQASASRRYVIEWNRLERKLYANDARVRHAPVLDESGALLGWQVEMLLAVAVDVELRDPDADAYRRRIRTIVDVEIDRRYPIRDGGVRIGVADEAPSRHSGLLDQAIHDERSARRLALARKPALQQLVDACSDSPRVRGNVEKVLNEIRARLGQRALEENWRPDPERFRREVIEKAAEESRAA